MAVVRDKGVFKSIKHSWRITASRRIKTVGVFVLPLGFVYLLFYAVSILIFVESFNEFVLWEFKIINIIFVWVTVTVLSVCYFHIRVNGDDDHASVVPAASD